MYLNKTQSLHSTEPQKNNIWILKLHLILQNPKETIFRDSLVKMFESRSLLIKFSF